MMILFLALIQSPLEVTSNDGHFKLHIQVAPQPVRANQNLRLEVEIIDLPEGATVRFDAAMPDHGHGLALPFTLTQSAPHKWIIEDLVLHMPGYWELYVDVTWDDTTERAQWSWEITP